MDLIFELAKKKPWLCEECGWILFQAIPQISAKPGNESYIQALVDKLHAHELTKTPEGVAIWLSVKSHSPNVSLPRDVWQHDDPLDKKESLNLANVLKGCATTKDNKGQDSKAVAPKGIWNSRLHFVWGILLATFVERETPIKRGEIRNFMTFQEFWKEAVDSKC